MVYVINYDGQPLMPCSQAIARLLLKYIENQGQTAFIYEPKGIVVFSLVTYKESEKENKSKIIKEIIR